ncbi:ComF family protein [Flavobacteriaceae bacterium M23B6Z8]
MKFKVVNILNDIENLFFPEACLACMHTLVTNEKVVCTSCRHELPFTNYHRYKDNPVEKMLYGRVKLENATALLSYREAGPVRNLIHHLKYKGQEEVGWFLGNLLGADLKEHLAYQDVAIVIPVPLHRKRLQERGYNQVALFGREIARALGATYNDQFLKRNLYSSTQTFKTRLMRWQQDQSIFAVEHESILQNKHILLVDDVITTGATLEACYNVLKDITGIKISIATMAITE